LIFFKGDGKFHDNLRLNNETYIGL
jgi:hypothetical protein